MYIVYKVWIIMMIVLNGMIKWNVLVIKLG